MPFASLSRPRQTREQCDPNHRGCPEFTPSFTWMLLIVLIAWATLTGFVAVKTRDKHIDEPFLEQAAIVILGALSMGMGGVVVRSKELGIQLFTFTTSLQLAITMIIIVLGNSESYEYFLLPCRILTFSLGFPHLCMCIRTKSGWMPILLNVTIVFIPLFVANLVIRLPAFLRFALLLPTVTVIAYQLVADFCRSGDVKKNVTSRLRISGAAMVVGISIAGALHAFDKQQSRACEVGFFLTMAGGLTFNLCLVIRRWKSPTKDPCASEWRIYGMGAILLLSIINLLGLYLCLEHCRIAVILPTFTLICIYFSLILLHDPRRELTWTCAYFFLIIAFFIATLCCLWETIVYDDLSRNFYDVYPVHFLEVLLVREQYKNKSATMWFATIQSSLILVYFMMTALVQTDPSAKRDDTASTQSHDERQELIIAKTAEIVEATADHSAPCGQPVPAEQNACSIESPEILLAPSIPASHVTLNIPD